MKYVTEILRCEVGSTLHGTGLPGREDRDEMGVAVERPQYVTGLRVWEQDVIRTQPEGLPSGPGDLDLTIFGLQKWMRLATQGNPSILIPLFAPESAFVTLTQVGRELRELAPHIVSKQAIPRFRGYMRSQCLRLLGLAGRKHGARAAFRPELVAEHGWDSKFGMHMVRLGFQGVELARTGRFELPMTGYAGDFCRAVRRGEITADVALETAFGLDAELEDLQTGSPLRDKPDLDTIERWMHAVYLATWTGAR